MKTWRLLSAIAGFGTLTVGLAAAADPPRGSHERAAIGHQAVSDKRPGSEMERHPPKGMLHAHGSERIDADHAINNHEGANEKRAIDEREQPSQLALRQPGSGRAADTDKEHPSALKANHSYTFGASSPGSLGTAAKSAGIPNQRTYITAARIGGPNIAGSKASAAILNGAGMKQRQ